MFDFGIGYTEIMVVAMVALIVIGPKDLPKVLRTIGQMTSAMRRMAGDFQRHLDDAMREAGVDDVRKEVKAMTSLDFSEDMRKTAEELKKTEADIKQAMAAGAPAAAAATPAAQPAAPVAPATPALEQVAAPAAEPADKPQPEPVRAANGRDHG